MAQKRVILGSLAAMACAGGIVFVLLNRNSIGSAESAAARDRSANTADPVVYDPPIQVEGPEKPIRGAIQFESRLVDEGGHKELIIRYNRDFDSTSNPTSAVYTQNFRVGLVGLKHGDAQKVRLIPLQETGMTEEGGSMDVAYGEIRYRVEGDGPFAAEDLQKIELKYQDKTYPVDVSNAKTSTGAR